MEQEKHVLHPDYTLLSKQDQELIERAITMLDRSYAPYSGFNVGSALRTKSGNIYTGCNQENAAYPLCMCGERVALYTAGAAEENVCVDTIAITVRHKEKGVEKPAAPCGGCRQVISEFETRGNHPIRILLKADGPEIIEFKNSNDLLPYSFNGTFL